MIRYLPKTVREYGRIHLAERLMEQGWECFIARRSPNEDEVVVRLPDENREVRLKFHAQESSQSVRFYNAGTLDWDWQCLVITTRVLQGSPDTYLLLRTDVQAEGALEQEFDGALWLEPRVFCADGFRNAWYKLRTA